MIGATRDCVVSLSAKVVDHASPFTVLARAKHFSRKGRGRGRRPHQPVVTPDGFGVVPGKAPLTVGVPAMPPPLPKAPGPCGFGGLARTPPGSPTSPSPFSYIPKSGRKGYWDGPPGNSGWWSALPEVNRFTGQRPVQYHNGYPDFAPFAKVTLTFEPRELHGRKDGVVADQKWANLVGMDWGTARALRRRENLDWHHVEDGQTMQLLPIPVHHACTHTGGASALRRMSGLFTGLPAHR